MLAQAGCDPDKKNRFGESPQSILEAGSKRISIFNKENVPRLADLEKLEVEIREKCISLPSALIQSQRKVQGVILSDYSAFLLYFFIKQL